MTIMPSCPQAEVEHTRPPRSSLHRPALKPQLRRAVTLPACLPLAMLKQWVLGYAAQAQQRFSCRRNKWKTKQDFKPAPCSTAHCTSALCANTTVVVMATLDNIEAKGYGFGLRATYSRARTPLPSRLRKLCTRCSVVHTKCTHCACV